jgi:hypothetical protein
MKCIKLTNGTVRRTVDEEARELVNSGKAVFITKRAWKHARAVAVDLGAKQLLLKELQGRK